MQPLLVDLIGCGSFGSEMATFIADLPEMSLRGVYDEDGDRASALAAKVGAEAFPRLDELLRSSGAAAVVIATPHDTHRNLAVAAARAGRHVFCEKAMARTVAECFDMIEAAAQSGVKLMVGHKRRLRPSYAYMGEILRSGVVGRPIAANVLGFHWRVWNRQTHWWARRSAVGGLLHWAGVHDVDTLRFLLGEVAAVYAVEGPKLLDHTDYADSLTVTMRFRSGAVASLQVSPYFPMFAYRRAFSYQIVCDRGGIWYDPTRMTVEHQVGDGPRTVKTFDEWGFDVAFAAELRSFARWVLVDEPPLLTGEDGLRCVEIMQAAYLSAAEHREISLPLARSETGPWNLGRR
jgi:phthalate 4,5-cis-dihydrodiol dehydrogenase